MYLAITVAARLLIILFAWIIIESHWHSHSLSVQSLWNIYWTTVAPRQVGHSKVTKLNAFHTNLPAEVANQRAAINAAKSQSIICRSVGFSDCAYVSLSVLLSVSRSLCPFISLHPKHAFGQGLNQRGSKRSRDSKHERESPPNSGHIFWAALSPGSWSAALLLLLLVLLLLLLLLLLLVLHSFVYWHFVMCCKWQPRHMDSNGQGDSVRSAVG